MHPELEELLAYVDGDLEAVASRKLERHLDQCPECLEEVQRLRFAALASDGPATAPPPQLLARIREWESQRRQEDPRGTVVEARVATELAPYLGDDASSRIVQAPSRDGLGVLARIEPVLELFLGCRAARNLVNTVVDRAIMRL